MLMTNFLGENLFDEFFGDFTRPERRAVKCTSPATSVMRTDVKENDEGYELHIDLPGYKKEDVKAELKDGNLTISASRNAENDEKDDNGKYIRRESFYVGDVVDQTDIKAKFEDGILKVFVPKKEAKPEVEESRYIAIEG